MRPGRIIIAMALGSLALAGAPALEAQSPPASYRQQVVPDAAARAERGTHAVLRALDKIAGTATELTLSPGASVPFGRLDIVLGECRYPAEDPDSDAFAQLTVTDRSAGTILFSGWMVASSPALSALDDARYDLWVVSCHRVSASGSGPDSSAETDSAAESLR